MAIPIRHARVTISLVGDQIQVSPEPAYITIPAGEVTWETTEKDFQFRIVFPQTSPFSTHQFHGGTGTPAVSGPAVAGNQRAYPYRVEPTNKSAVLTLDPTVRPTP